MEIATFFVTIGLAIVLVLIASWIVDRRKKV